MKPLVSLSVAMALGCTAPAATPDAALTDAALDRPAHDHDVADASGDRPPSEVGTPRPNCLNGVPAPYPGQAPFDDTRPYPNWQLATLDPDQGFSLGAHYTPCETSPKLLVIRVFAAWSGPAQWYAAHTQALRARPDAARLTVIDLLSRDEDNLPPTREALAAWRARYDVMPDALALEPDYQLSAVFFGGGRLPIIALVDPRTMRSTRTLVDPDAPEFDAALNTAMARLDGRPAPPREPVERVDGRFTRDQWEQLVAMAAPGAPPPSPSNRYADSPEAARLGAALFSDPGFSANGQISCVSCHDPQRGHADGRPTALGLERGPRNTPAIALSAWQRWQFWDGRADSLWAQALGPVENPSEMGFDRVALAHRLATTHRAAWEAVYGPLPALDDRERFPPHGAPGMPAWEAMAPADRETINRLYVGFGKAIEAFERTLRLRPSAFDRYLAGDRAALSEEARDGLRRFVEFGCNQCHHGPTLSDGAFHNIAMPTGRSDGQGDEGRLAGFAAWRESPFRRDGAYSDQPSLGPATAHRAPFDAMRGQFRTPPLRGVGQTGPWGHGGTFTDLPAIIDHYARVSGEPTHPGSVGPLDPHLGMFHMDATALNSLSAFLRALNPE
ncbi:MAG: hypothetical protein JNK72_00130 [Myxococcales bacterium]|nr:hypothetical protein [Myxococcales bacterium]